MNYLKFKDDIKKENLNSVYLFIGEEEYIMDEYIEIIKNKYIDKNFETMNYLEIDKNNDFDDIFNACETLPFMSDKKMIYIKNVEEFINSDSSNRDKLNDYIPELSKDVILILKDINGGLRKNTRLFKTLRDLNAIVEFTRLNNQQLGLWSRQIIESKNKKISNNNLNYFLQRSGYLEYRSEKTLFELENELLKIIDHSSKEEIDKKDIDSNLVEDLDTNIFNLLDFINQKNTEASMNLVDEMYRANEPLGRVFFMIIRQYRLLLKYKSFSERGYNNSEIRKKLGISPYEFQKIRQNSRRHNKKDLIEQLDYMLDMDRKQKTSSQDEKLAMELLIVKLTKNK